MSWKSDGVADEQGGEALLQQGAAAPPCIRSLNEHHIKSVAHLLKRSILEKYAVESISMKRDRSCADYYQGWPLHIERFLSVYAEE